MFGLKYHWLDLPDLNTEENKFDMMNSYENPLFPTTDGEDILPEQKEIIENKLRNEKRDGTDCD